MLPENAPADKPVLAQQPSQIPITGPRKLNRRIVAGLVLTVVALVLASLAAVMPWWHIDSKVSAQGIPPSTFSWDFYTGTWCYRSSNGYRCMAYGDTSSSGRGWSAVSSSFGIGFLLLIGGVVLAATTLAMIVMSSRKEKARTVTLALGIVGTALLLGAVFYLFAALPGAFNADYRTGAPGATWSVSGFFGSTVLDLNSSLAVGTETFSYYGALGWWLALLSPIILIAGTVVACGRKRTIVQAGPPESSPKEAK